jgi:PAS domain S-box-containing protein
MKLVLDKQTKSLTIIFFWINVAIGLVWFYWLAKIFVGLFINTSPFPFWTCLGDGALALLITVAFRYFHKQFYQYIADSIKDHIKLFKKNPYPMWVYDLNTLHFLTVNDAAIALYGFSEAEFLSMKITDIRPMEDVPALISAADKVKLNFHHQYHWSGTWRHKKKDGQMMYVEISSYEIMFGRNKAELVLAYNVTDKVLQDQKLQALNQDLERKVMLRTDDLLHLNRRLIDQNKVIKSANLELFTISNQLQEANQKIQEHSDLKNRFISMASHEFRTPLANITFSAAFLRRNLNKLEPGKITAKLNSIETWVAHMVALLDDVLTIGKADAVQMEVKDNPVELHPFLTGIIEEVQTACNDSHTICMEMEEDVPSVISTDIRFLRNIFINLLNNAVKYSTNGRTVVLRVFGTESDIHFDVIDQGMGIHKEDIEKVFEPFYRTAGTNTIQGTGLGLSIVKRAVDLLNATISIQSEVGKGSTFTVTLPLFSRLNGKSGEQSNAAKRMPPFPHAGLN